MLIGFRLRNFLSYSAEQYFTFASSADPEHLDTHVVPTSLRAVPRLSKAAIILGPNGSGKTNLLLGLSTLRQLVLQSHGWSAAQFRRHHNPNGSIPSDPTEFEIELLLGTTRYRYALAYCANRIRFEKLEVHSCAKSQRWYERRAATSEESELWAPFSSSFFGAREMWRKSTGPRDLFLTTAARLGGSQLAPLVEWFEKCIDIGVLGDDETPAWVPQKIMQPAYKERLLRMFNDVELPLNDVRVYRAEPGNAAPSQDGRSATLVELQHKRPEGDVWINPKFESAGTRRLVQLFARFLEAIECEKLLVLDEFDQNLHTLVARYLVGLIANTQSAHNRAQLLLTTHKINLMDLSIFRRDEIWFSHLDEFRDSALYRLSSRGVRKHEAVVKAYLTGRYGAVPSIRPAAGVDVVPTPVERNDPAWFEEGQVHAMRGPRQRRSTE